MSALPEDYHFSRTHETRNVRDGEEEVPTRCMIQRTATASRTIANQLHEMLRVVRGYVFLPVLMATMLTSGDGDGE